MEKFLDTVFGIVLIFVIGYTLASPFLLLKARHEAQLWHDSYMRLDDFHRKRAARDIEDMEWILQITDELQKKMERVEELRKMLEPQAFTPLNEMRFDTIVTTNSFDNSVWTNRIPRGFGYGIELCNRRAE